MSYPPPDLLSKQSSLDDYLSKISKQITPTKTTDLHQYIISDIKKDLINKNYIIQKDLYTIINVDLYSNQDNTYYQFLQGLLAGTNAPNSQQIGLSQRPINWGVNSRDDEPRAYIQPSPEDVEKVLAAIHMVGSLPAEQQRQLVEATREIRYFVDGQIRARFGATNHFNAIRCLNDPQRTDVNGPLAIEGVQLVGEEYFGINRFMTNYPDIADIQWWALYQGGSWDLDTWNPQGEHLDTGVNGWGNLLGSVLKVNGRVLVPQEIIALFRTMRLRNERGFQTDFPLDHMEDILRYIHAGVSLPGNEEQLERLVDLGLVTSSGRELTYVGQSMITPTTALERRRRQETESDPELRRIIHPILFN